MSPTRSALNLASLLGQRVLIVDDAEDERKLLAHYLQQQGCRIYLARDGVDGVNKAQLVQPDLILMDVRMPVCDGVSACQALKRHPNTQQIPVIFLTGAASPAERVQGLLVGAIDYITKPFNFEEVRLRLSIHLKPRATTEREVTAAGATVEGIPRPTSNFDTIVFESAKLHLLKDLGEVPDLHTLAESVGTNARRLNEAFKHCVGVTVFEYLREERMKEAAQLLGETSIEIQDIAGELGFTSGSNFAAAFRERFGMTPRAFRKSRQALPV
jgi:DNA-binding response OmpR family regulator